MDNNFKSFLEERLKFSHYVLFWCNRELENNKRVLHKRIEEHAERRELINIKKKLKYIHSKILFEKREILFIKKALTECDQ